MNKLYVSTIDSFCNRILRENALELGINPEFRILDEIEEKLLFIRVCGRTFNYKGLPKVIVDKSIESFIDDLYRYIIQLRNNAISSRDFLLMQEKVKEENRELCRLISKIYSLYEQEMKDNNLFNFSGLLLETLKMLAEKKAIKEKYRKQFRYVLVDEYQDTTPLQHKLLRMFSDNYFVVGDVKQSIYGFRGSDNKYFKRFSLDFPGCEKIILTKNYRSSQTILDASFQMISKSLENEEKLKVFSDVENIKKLIIKETATERAEAVAIGKMIEKLVGGTSFFSMDAGKTDPDEQKEYSFADFAILYRTRRQCEIFISVFEKEGIPFQTADKKKFFEIEGIKQLINFCRNMVKSADFPDEFKDCDIETGLKFLCKKENLSKIIKGNDKAEQAFEKLLSIARLHDDLKSFLNALVLNQDTDTLEFNTEKVSLMTLHAAKGLEFPVVFVAGCEQGLIPFAKDGKNINDLEEERRLFYVAMTRAMDILCLTYAKKRSIYGKRFKRQRSCFIEDIEKKLTQVEKSFVPLKVREKEKQLELF